MARADGGVGGELVPKRRREGGFAINTGRVAARLGFKPILPGLYGKGTIDPAYHEFQDTRELLFLGAPEPTIAHEFGDGKVLMSNLEAVSSLSWNDVKERLGEPRLKDLFSGVDILGQNDWSLTANFDGLFQGFMEQCASTTPPRRMIFDFADIKKTPANPSSAAWSRSAPITTRSRFPSA